MEAFLVPAGVVAVAEIGDKTQLLAFLLAARFRKPLPIVFGILVATLANHAFAAGIGAWIASLLSPGALRWIVGASFIAVAAWVLVPDSTRDTGARWERAGVFCAALAAFFLAEMGDKTQIATVALTAKYASLTAVVAGTTLGMLIANVPVVCLGGRCAERVPLRLARGIAALAFTLLGVATLAGAGRALGL